MSFIVLGLGGARQNWPDRSKVQISPCTESDGAGPDRNRIVQLLDIRPSPT